MHILVSDSSMLIEFSKRDLLDRMFELSFQFAVPDLLFNEELIDLGRYDRQTSSDLAFASRPRTLQAWRLRSPIKAGAAPSASWIALPWLWHIIRGTPCSPKTGA